MAVSVVFSIDGFQLHCFGWFGFRAWPAIRGSCWHLAVSTVSNLYTVATGHPDGIAVDMRYLKGDSGCLLFPPSSPVTRLPVPRHPSPSCHSTAQFLPACVSHSHCLAPSPPPPSPPPRSSSPPAFTHHACSGAQHSYPDAPRRVFPQLASLLPGSRFCLLRSMYSNLHPQRLRRSTARFAAVCQVFS